MIMHWINSFSHKTFLLLDDVFAYQTKTCVVWTVPTVPYTKKDRILISKSCLKEHTNFHPEVIQILISDHCLIYYLFT